MPTPEEDIFFGAQAELFRSAKELRKNSTRAEQLLWEFLRNRRLKGFKFRRQHPLGYFVADFYCHEARLVVEVDGKVHEIEIQEEHDEDRTAMLNQWGIRVLRFTNDEVLSDLDRVLKRIADFLPHPRPLSNGEGRS